ncbi:glutamate receptor 2.9-like [Neltuma alba]|uniref:glutamate receptor 2.9-like n=1 Tax=Neltuma alba TaxID=207710 RepID=UPI0010A578C4|nr:glutamate receptor 2.9-like [Prosopis alba]
MLFLSHCSSCKMTGPIYKGGGFAFAFPKNSSLVSSFSAAILNVTQNVMKFRDMKNNISLPVTIDKSEYNSDVETRGLTKDDFGGLFPIVYSVLALFFSISILKAQWLQKKWITCWTVRGGGVIC